jgi:hypothetical protein
MATSITYVRTDSLDPRIASDVEDVVFFNPLTGEKLEIQLGTANRKHFENHLAKLEKYIGAAEVVEVPAPVKAKPAAKATGELALIREWARANGFTVGDRGRIKAEIKDAYYAAQVVTQPDAEVVSDLEINEPVKLVEVSDEVPETAEALPSTEAEVIAAHEAGYISGDDVLALLDEIDSEKQVDSAEDSK